MRDTLHVAAVPIVHFILGIVVFMTWLGCLFCVISMNDIKADPIFPQMKTLTWKKEVKWLTVAMIFGIFWLLTFIENISNFIVMVSASTYYYNNSPATVND